ncbi:PQQ-binding-like beta-propeller repeat protein [Reichenbachiella sp. MALMAid0571]|uniref:outer membrane protein assembly factor BamB family protein n=1 Tax=Reichenbachiella sp. MALMAid0571 TaxID=3143939 RepID=UPI0032DE511C
MMNFQRITLLFAVLTLALSACETPYVTTENDWPQYQRDNYRSAATNVNIKVKNLSQAWEYNSVQEPVPAWFGPAKWDAYAKVIALPSMRNYDPVFHPVIVRDNVYFGSTADDGLHALDVKTGVEKWVFPAGAPIRIAPAYNDGKLYFGADDGYAYCISAKDGKLIWKYSPSEGEQNLLHNDRMISRWPVRTGVIIEEGTAYFAASMLPWQVSYVCAVDAKTGKPTGEGRYVKEFNDLTMEGPIVSSGEKIIIPQGRISPLIFKRKTGEKEGTLPGSGGCFVLITPEKNIIHNPNSKKNFMMETSTAEMVKEPSVMSYEHGKGMVISGDTAYIMADYSISAFHRKNKKTLWVNKKYGALSIVKGGNALYVGGVDTVYAVNPQSGETMWKQKVTGMTYGLALADSAVFASTNEGNMYCFRPTEGKIFSDKAMVSEKVDTSTLKMLNKPRLQEAQKVFFEEVEKGFQLEKSPLANFTKKDEAIIRYRTLRPSPTIVHYGVDELSQVAQSEVKKTEHEIKLKGLRKNYSYNYRITVEENGVEHVTRAFELDNFFNHHKFSIADDINPFIGSKFQKAASEEAAKLLKDNNSQGMCLVFGFDGGELAFEIAKQGGYHVIGVESPEYVNGARLTLLKHGVYGKKISIWSSDQLDKLPKEFANLVVASKSVSKYEKEISDAVIPKGVVMIRSSELNKSGKEDKVFVFASYSQDEEEKTWTKLKKPKLEDSGVWSHQYGKPDNSAYGGESLWGATTTSDFQEKWIGRPGPRFQSDRNARKTSPLAINGRLFVQGLERIAAIDSYNGTFLWTNSQPDFRRFNVPRDCSNWSADDDFLYTAVGKYCHKVDAATGKAVNSIVVSPRTSTGEQFDWGYLANIEGQIIGSAVKPNNIYTEFTGGESWYDAIKGDLARKVSSDNLFSLDKSNNQLQWQYEGGMIINSTITLSDDKAFFVECRDSRIMSSDNRRLDLEKLNNKLYMVALDVRSGEKLWEQKLDVVAGITVFFLVHSADKLVLSSSNSGKYHIYTFDAENGKPGWTEEMSWYSGDHGGHMSKPAITGGKLIMRPAVFDLQTGKRLPNDMPKGGHGCGSYACTDQSLFYRGGSVTMWNSESNDLSKWERLRPDCWISTIPADGMILSPEGGGGCSCGSWLETSIAFAPKSRAPIMFDTKGKSEYVDELELKMVLREGQKGMIRYTLDGSVPDKNSTVYNEPITLKFKSEVTATIYDETGENIIDIRRKKFKRNFPAPAITVGKEIIEGKMKVVIKSESTTGKTVFTLDGSKPTVDSQEYEKELLLADSTVVNAITFWKNDEGVWVSGEPRLFKVAIPVLKKSVNMDGLVSGISYQYYQGAFKSVNDFGSLSVLKEGVEPMVSLAPKLRDENFALRYTGFIKVEKRGIYNFATVSDDGSTVLIGNDLVVDADGSHSAKFISGEVALEAGLHPIIINYFQGTEGNALSLHYEGPGLEKQEVPAEALFYQSNKEVQ